MDISITVTNQSMVAQKKIVAIGAVDYIRCVFDFTTDDWSDTVKYACFQRSGEEEVVIVPIDYYSGERIYACIIPARVLEQTGTIKCSAVGIKSHTEVVEGETKEIIDYRITSHQLKLIKAKDTLYARDSDAVIPASMIETIMAELERIRDDAQSARDAAQGAATSAASSSGSAATSAQTATEKASQAAASASSAATSATSASDSAADALANKNAASDYAGQAATSASGASTARTDAISAKNAAQSAQTIAETASSTATSQATLARSYARGDTSSRSGEATDNAKYYKEQSDTILTQVQTAGTTAVGNINDAKTSAVSAVQTAQSSGVSAVEDAEASALSEIATAQSIGIVTDMAQGYDSTKTYEIGEYVMYQNALYRCVVDIDTAEEWNSAHWEATLVGEELEKKANINGHYDDMTVGNAKQLVSTIFEEDQVPYNFRTAGGSMEIGDRLEESIVGGTVAWNQLAKEFNNANWSVEENYVTVSYSDGIATISSTVSQYGIYMNNGLDYVAGHVYFGRCFAKNGGGNTLAFNYGKSGFAIISKDLTNDNEWHEMAFVQKNNNATTNQALFIYAKSGSVGYQNLSVKNPVIIDLTQMFGATIADYIYNLEQANAGAGVSFFRKLFPKPYYEYNAGELMSVQAANHITRGFNAWDEEWEIGEINVNTGEVAEANNRIRSKNFIPCVPGTEYYFYGANASNDLMPLFYDKNKVFISAGIWSASGTHVQRTPDNCYYIKFRLALGYGVTYNHDVCINISWDGERDGEYEPYEEHNYPLDDTLQLRGIWKLDSHNQLYFDGDEYYSDGTVVRKYGIKDIGSINHTEDYVGDGYKRYQFYIDDIKNTPFYKRWSIFSDKLVESPLPVSALAQSNGEYMCVYGTVIYATTKDINSILSGYIIYPLAEPIIEQAAPYQSPQIVNNFGTEQYTDAAYEAGDRDVEIPVGHISKYAPNLRAKLEMAPDSPHANGDYIVRQADGQNAYVPLVIPKELPNPPSEDGTYRLTITVSDGTPTVTWEALS